jgi:type IV pilus assembly protein PilC
MIDLKTFQTKLEEPKKELSVNRVLSKKESIWNIELTNKKLSDRKKEKFYSELEILLSAGIDIRAALELALHEQKRKADNQIIQEILRGIISGKSFSQSMEESGKFTAYEYFSIGIGEEAGELKRILRELTKYFQQKVALRRQITSALVYPAIVLSTSFGAIFFMLNFVVPMFAGVFKRYGAELPMITKWILDISGLISKWYPLFFIVIIGLIISFYRTRKQKWFRKISSTLLLKLPIMGSTFRKIYLARFCNSMELLISSRVQLTKAVDMVEQMISFYPIESTLPEIKKDLINGVSLHSAMQKFKIYEKRMVGLIKIGEEVNKLEEIFRKLRDGYSDDVEHETKLFGTLLEPFIIIILGVIVGFILIAMYLPLFMLGTNIK